MSLDEAYQVLVDQLEEQGHWPLGCACLSCLTEDLIEMYFFGVGAVGEDQEVGDSDNGDCDGGGWGCDDACPGNGDVTAGGEQGPPWPEILPNGDGSSYQDGTPHAHYLVDILMERYDPHRIPAHP